MISELLKAFTAADNYKSPGNDCISKEFYLQLWHIVKKPLCVSNQESFRVGELRISLKGTIIKSLKKKDRDKR